MFVKGLPMDPWAIRQGREAMVNPHVGAVGSRLLWHERAAGWDLLSTLSAIADGSVPSDHDRSSC
jgi:hypothetical protein